MLIRFAILSTFHYLYSLPFTIYTLYVSLSALLRYAILGIRFARLCYTWYPLCYTSYPLCYALLVSYAFAPLPPSIT